jgi:long-subunit acyl-CoA synthetase (AMP-forming)
MLNLHDIHMSYLPLAHMFERVVEVRTETDRMTRSRNPSFLFTLVKTETARIDHP